MARTLQVEDHLSLEEIDNKIKETKNKDQQRRWQIIYHAKVEKSNSDDIGRRFNIEAQSVRRIISIYNRLGVAGIETKGRGKGRRSYLSLEEEKEFLDTLRNDAIEGKIVTVNLIQIALKERLGHSVSIDTVYRLLKRHGWRKVTPRPIHPQTDKKLSKDFKKYFPEVVKKK